mmetsp:Transcript_1483/g.5101  ORF Transcript_1483/g.5101 Transcript_1483/m.5101 type:complete len:349 (+) Transcript_1483:247-1293(+)
MTQPPDEPMARELSFTRGAMGTFDSRVRKRRDEEREERVASLTSGNQPISLAKLKELQQGERYDKHALNSRFAYNTMRNAWQANRQLDIRQMWTAKEKIEALDRRSRESKEAAVSSEGGGRRRRSAGEDRMPCCSEVHALREEEEPHVGPPRPALEWDADKLSGSYRPKAKRARVTHTLEAIYSHLSPNEAGDDDEESEGHGVDDSPLNVSNIQEGRPSKTADGEAGGQPESEPTFDRNPGRGQDDVRRFLLGKEVRGRGTVGSQVDLVERVRGCEPSPATDPSAKRHISGGSGTSSDSDSDRHKRKRSDRKSSRHHKRSKKRKGHRSHDRRERRHKKLKRSAKTRTT